MDINLKYTTLLKEQIATVKKECRYLEFKSNYQEPDKLGKYISALSNGACLEHKDFAYLYFGIDDETLQAKGTTFDATRINAVGNEALELYLRRMIISKINFLHRRIPLRRAYAHGGAENTGRRQRANHLQAKSLCACR